ncbi:MAG TPA: RHS repeat-associated core domain-containing protein, partial [Terriglobales bacterium]
QRVLWIDVGHGTPTTNNYYLYDHLGTTRKIVNQFGTLCYDADYFPWGAVQNLVTNTCRAQNYKFTGKERDPDMGQDYFGARFYKGDMSRFFSPDWASSPEPVPYSKLDHPQSLNLYTYVQNNPTSFRDADGHDCDSCVSAMTFLSAFANAWSSDNAFGAGRQDQNTQAGSLGAEAGDTAAMVTGLIEVGAGGTEAAATLPAAGTVVGAVVPAAGAMAAIHGAGTAATATTSLFKAGGVFSKKSKAEVTARDNGTCQRCGVKTTPAQQSTAGVTPPGNEGQTDHIVPRSKGGD